MGTVSPDVCEKVQEKVKNAIENMTGLIVLDVNIKIAGVSPEEKVRNKRKGRCPRETRGVLSFLANLFLDCVVIAVGMDVQSVLSIGMHEEIRLFF